MQSPQYIDTSLRPIVCAGEALVDLIADPGGDWGAFDRMIPRIGGAPANMSVAITRLGGRARFVGTLADDGPGRWIRRRLEFEGVDLSDCGNVSGFCTRIAMVTGPSDDREFTFYGESVADHQMTVEHMEQADLASVGAVIAGSLALKAEPSKSAMLRILSICRTRDIPFIFDPNPRPALWPDPADAFNTLRPFIEQATILKLGAGELATLGVDTDALRRTQPANSVLVITDGARGSWYWYGEQRAAFVPSFCVRSVDSTGAGDAFTAALGLRYVQRGRRLERDDVLFASAAGALATTAAGAMDALPTLEQVTAILEERN
jgi:fructokinase